MNRRSHNALAALFTAITGFLWLWPTRPNQGLRITFLDVGQGDSIVLETPAGNVMVVDTGGSIGSDNMGRKVLVPFLRSHGIRKIDGLLLTHPDEDHIAGANWVIQNYPVSHLMISGIQTDNKHYNDALRAARAKNIPIQLMRQGTTLDFHDGVTAETLNPSEDMMVSHNNGSIVLRVRYGKTGILLTGDAEMGAEQKMVDANKPINAEVLKLGHHGSHTSTTQPFLNAVNPQAVIISAGSKNRFGHPHKDVLQRIKSSGIRLFRTDLQGAIECNSDGQTITMTPKKSIPESSQWLNGTQVH